MISREGPKNDNRGEITILSTSFRAAGGGGPLLLLLLSITATTVAAAVTVAKQAGTGWEII